MSQPSSNYELVDVNIALTLDNRFLKEIADWIINYIAKPKMIPNREKPVCPRAEKAINNWNIKLVDRTSNSPINFEEEITSLEKLFYETVPIKKEDPPEYSILFVFNDCSFEEIERHCLNKKTYFLNKKLLVGKFHPEYHMYTLDDHSAFIKPPPYPILAIRELVHQDFRFLKYANANDEKIKGYIEAYNRLFKGS